MKTAKAFGVATAIAVATLFLSSGGSAQPLPPKPKPAPAGVQPAPFAVVLYLDRGLVLRQSSVGKDLAAQVDALTKKMEADFAPESKKLQADIQALQDSATAPSPGQPQANAQQLAQIKAVDARRQAFQKKVQDRQSAIQAGFAQSRAQVEKALAPILETIMNERTANLLLDRGLVVLGAKDLDVTPLVIQRLNAALPKVTVTPIAAPAKAATPAKPGG